MPEILNKLSLHLGRSSEDKVVLGVDPIYEKQGVGDHRIGEDTNKVAYIMP